ncbi:hypothetical protein K439DRAFT_1613399 [Ramaria rubella]|nr:hypothetical protein K439DRAFT_1613399 [Ramaria rubella]
MHLFGLFHVTGQPLTLEPDFSPAAQEAGFGNLAVVNADISHPMSYLNHANRIKLMHEKNNVAISKVTHAGRIWSALIMRQYGSNCYDQELPLEGLLGAAMFNAQKPEGHFLASQLPDIEAQLFPWVEEQMMALDACYKSNPKAMDLSLQSFPNLLKKMCWILVQALAVLYIEVPEEVPDCMIYYVLPFNTQEFHEYAEAAPGLLSEAEANAWAALKNLPEHMAQTLQGVVQNAVASQKAWASLHEDHFKALEEACVRMEGYLGLLVDGTSQKHRRTQTQLPIHKPPPFPCCSRALTATAVPSDPCIGITSSPSEVAQPGLLKESEVLPVNMLGPIPTSADPNAGSL